MDESLRCNSLPCRKVLQTEGRAVSTSCSHIFCYECATTLLQGRRICPACNTKLEHSDDAIVTSLNPSASYKASVLAGLSPQTIMEICSRAIAFHHYQTTQEAVFQQMLLKKTQESVSIYERELERVELAAKTEISHLESKCTEMQRELDQEKRRTRELQEIVRSSGRDYEKLKTQFDQSKRNAVRTELSQSTAHQGFPNTPQGRSTNTSIPQPFFSASASRPTPSASPRLMRASRLTEDTTSLWNTPGRTMTQSHDLGAGYSSVYPTSRTFNTTASRSNTPQKPAQQHQQPPPYHVADSTPHKTPFRGGAQKPLTPIRAMPLPPNSARRPSTLPGDNFTN